MRQVPLIVLALHGIHVVCMFLLLQRLCPEISNIHHGVSLKRYVLSYVLLVMIHVWFLRHSNNFNNICSFLVTFTHNYIMQEIP